MQREKANAMIYNLVADKIPSVIPRSSIFPGFLWVTKDKSSIFTVLIDSLTISVVQELLRKPHEKFGKSISGPTNQDISSSFVALLFLKGSWPPYTLEVS
jgi:hypothetical protein